MQKKLIALAVAGLVSAPAFAQSNVTIYGSVDFGYTLQNRHIDSDVRSRSAVDSGVSKANRLGFKGTEELGNGLKVGFTYEAGIQGDRNGSDGLWGGAGDRQSFVNLQTKFGVVQLGRQYTPQHLYTAAIDPFGKNGLGDASNVQAQDARLDNLLAYVSPTWGGFNFVAGYTNSYGGDEGAGNKSDSGVLGATPLQDARVWAFAPSYTLELPNKHKVFIAGNIHQARTNESDQLKSLRVLEGYASYDLGVVKVSGLLGKRTTELHDGNDIKLLQWLVGVTAKVGPNGKILASYNRRKIETDEGFPGNLGDQAKLGQLAVGYEHSLSPRTTLYTQYVHQYHNRQQKELLSLDSSLRTVASIVGATTTGAWTDGYRQGLAVGIRHDF